MLLVALNVYVRKRKKDYRSVLWASISGKEKKKAFSEFNIQDLQERQRERLGL